MTRSLRLVVAVVVAFLSSPSHAQAISGTFSAAFTGFDQYGQPTVHLALSLQCGLTCTSAAPTLHYGVSGLADAHMVASPTQSVGYVSVGFATGVEPTGSSVADNTSFPPGSNFYAVATSATCWCGNASGQGGFIDLTTTPVHVPPWVKALNEPVVVGSDPLVIINATPVGGEMVDVQVAGGGLDQSFHFTPADFNIATSGPVTGGSKSLPLVFTAPGQATITVSVGGAPPYVATLEVMANPTGAGGGSGGGAATGGGSPPPASGCNANVMPGSASLALALLVFALRSARRRA
jgi:uncharacterized protein (TIGR03382 family)